MPTLVPTLPPRLQAAIAAARGFEAAHRMVFRSLDDPDLAATARFWMSHCEAPGHTPGTPVYDSTFWRIILPEMIARLERPS